MEIALNYSFIAWTAILAILAKKNADLSSLLIVMMIPKILDLIILTPSLQWLKSGDLKYLFYVVHGLNDILMIALIKYRFIASSVILKRSIYRRLSIEKYIVSIYAVSVIYNIAVIGDFLKIWKDYLNFTGYPFFTYYSETKRILMFLEVIVMTVLTAQTLKAVIDLKKHGLIK